MLTEFQAELRAFIAETGMAPSTMGRLAINDSRYVLDVLNGRRTPTLRTAAKVQDFMRRCLAGDLPDVATAGRPCGRD